MQGQRCKASFAQLVSRYTPRSVRSNQPYTLRSNPASIGCNHPKIAGPAWAGPERCSAGESLLPVGGHDRLPRRTAWRWIATAPRMFAEQARTATLIRPRPVWPGLRNHLYPITCHVDGH